MRILLVVLISLIGCGLTGQSVYVRKAVELHDVHTRDDQSTTYINTVALLTEPAQPFLAVNLEWRSSEEMPADKVRIQIQKEDHSEPWISPGVDEHTGDGKTHFFSNMLFLEPDVRWIQIRIQIDQPWDADIIDSLILHLFDPGPSNPDLDFGLVPEVRNDACNCPPPSLVDRAQWCPDGTCFPHPSPEPVFPSHLIIHHSAGSNSSSDWAAVVRSIWNFHVNGNGWSDIGYNWLVDPDGKIYIGRGDGILGAHFCGKNTNTLGTCVMGDFTVVTPTDPALAALADLYAWKACEEEIDPLESSFHPASNAVIPNISGHRQSCNTSCPGNAFFPMLPQVREQIAAVINQCDCDLLEPSGLVAKSMASQVHLTWDPIAGATSYLLERRGPGDPEFSLLARVGNTVYLDLTVQPGQIYSYRVRADDGNCSSNPSLLVTVHIADEWFTVLPTVVTDQVAVDIRNTTADPVRMRMFSADGRQIWAGEFGKASIDFFHAISMSDFPAGIYILVVQNGPVRQTVRLIKL